MSKHTAKGIAKMKRIAAEIISEPKPDTQIKSRSQRITIMGVPQSASDRAIKDDTIICIPSFLPLALLRTLRLRPRDPLYLPSSLAFFFLLPYNNMASI